MTENMIIEEAVFGFVEPTEEDFSTKEEKVRHSLIKEVMEKLDMDFGVLAFEEATGMDTTPVRHLHHDIKALEEILASDDEQALAIISENIWDARLNDTFTGNWVLGSPLDKELI